jgi:hypothetical protein
VVVLSNAQIVSTDRERERETFSFPTAKVCLSHNLVGDDTKYFARGNMNALIIMRRLGVSK